MHKEVTVKEDGRLLVYYTFESARASRSAAADNAHADSKTRAEMVKAQNQETLP